MSLADVGLGAYCIAVGLGIIIGLLVVALVGWWESR